MLMRTLIDEIQIFEDKQPDGRIVKSVKLSIPVVYDGEISARIGLDKNDHDESIVCLSRKEVSAYLRISVNTEDLETNAGRIYSNDDIKQYIEDKYGFKVHSAYIGQVREKLGIREHENYHDSHTSPRKPCVCPEEKETAILDALKHFGLIQ